MERPQFCPKFSLRSCLRARHAPIDRRTALCAPLITFSPIIRDVFHKDASLFSFAVGSFGFGALLGVICLLSLDATRDRRRLSSGSGLGYRVILTMVALNPWF